MTAIAGQTVLVTGANRGMGRAYIGQLLDRGAAKVYAAARDPLRIDVADPRVVPLALDVTDAGSVAAAAAAAGDVGVLINNAGIAHRASVLAPDVTLLREELETNLLGPIAMASVFAERLIKVRGTIVNVASITAWLPGSTYGVSKAALWNATNSMRAELAPKGVQVVGVYVGLVDTEMTSFAPDRPKLRPESVVRQVLDAIESGAAEVLVDERTRQARAQLSTLIDER